MPVGARPTRPVPRGHRRGQGLSRDHRLGEPLPRRVAVLRALHLGDLLCALPALRSLRAGLPDAEITLIGLPWAREFAARFDAYLDRFVEFPGFPGLPERDVDTDALATLLLAERRDPYDLVVQMHGSGAHTNDFCALLGGDRLAGYFVPENYCPDSDRFLPYPDRLPEVHRHLALMRFLGLPETGDELEFPLRDSDYRALQALDPRGRWSTQPYAVVHPGARVAERRWSLERFVQIGDRLAALGLRVVITGSAEERPIATALGDTLRAPPVDLTGRTDLGTLGAVIAGARLLVCNDTGVSHLAAALRVPSVVVFSASEVERWAPLDQRLHRVVRASAPGSTERVWSACRDLLGTEVASVA